MFPIFFENNAGVSAPPRPAFAILRDVPFLHAYVQNPQRPQGGVCPLFWGFFFVFPVGKALRRKHLHDGGGQMVLRRHFASGRALTPTVESGTFGW